MTRGGSEQVFIVVRAPNGDVREFPISNVAIVIGRDESADIRVEDRKVSRRHAAFKLIDGQPWVDDLGSINGIKLNGKKVSERAMMLAGDVVMVGGYEVMLKDAPRRRPGGSDPRSDRTPAVDMPSERTYDPRSPPRSDTAQARLILVGQTKPVLGKRFTLGFGESIVGRLEECAVPILDGSVSRQHAKIVVTTERATVSDLASSNGSFVNDIRVDNADLTNGDRLKFGSINFDVELTPEIPSRVGPIEPSYHLAAIRPPPAAPRGRFLIAVGAGVLLVAITVFFGMWRYSDRVRAIFGKRPLAQIDATASPDAAAMLAEAPRPDSGAPASTPTIAAAPADAGVAPEPALMVAIRTSTSPYGKKDATGRPLDLPAVDQSFDFDAFVRSKLEEAAALESGGQFAEVRRVVAELLAQDPINQDAQQIRRRIDLAEQGQQALAQGDQLRADSKLLRALDVYATVTDGSPAFAEAQQRIAALKPVAIKREINRAEAELRKKKTWDEAHRRLKRVLELEPEHPLAKPMIVSLETKMRDAGMKFRALGDATSLRANDRGAGSATRREEIAKRWEDRGLVRIVQTYAAGDIGDAIKRAEVAFKRAKGPKKQLAKNLSASLKKLQNKYERVKNEVTNDPAQAWAHLMEFQKIELEVLPENMKSYLVTELEETIAEAFAERGTDFYNQDRFELAFQNWDSGFKLDPSNSKIVVGLRNLENKAEGWVKEAELAAQRGQPDACDQWQRITRMTRMTSELYKKARDRLQKGGCN